MQKIFFALVVFCAANVANAHPIGFRDSVGVMTTFSKDERNVEINYSLRHWLAVSTKSFWFTRGTDRPDVLLGGVNGLIHRWNGENYQGNLYAETGFGRSRLSGSDRGAYYVGLLGDIEDRKYYALAHISTLRNSSGRETNHYKIRLGIAPYVEEFSALHTWLILQADRYTHVSSRYHLTPFLRFFYRNVLWEIGSSLQGDLKLNTIIHF